MSMAFLKVDLKTQNLPISSFFPGFGLKFQVLHTFWANSLHFPGLEKWMTKFQVFKIFQVEWEPCELHDYCLIIVWQFRYMSMSQQPSSTSLNSIHLYTQYIPCDLEIPSYNDVYIKDFWKTFSSVVFFKKA